MSYLVRLYGREAMVYLSLELFEHVHLLAFLRGGFAHLLLLLVKHHFLDHAAGFTVEIAQFGVLRGDFGRVNLGVGHEHMLPPRHLVDFFKVDLKILVVFQHPRGILQFDFIGQLVLFAGKR